MPSRNSHYQILPSINSVLSTNDSSAVWTPENDRNTQSKPLLTSGHYKPSGSPSSRKSHLVRSAILAPKQETLTVAERIRLWYRNGTSNIKDRKGKGKGKDLVRVAGDRDHDHWENRHVGKGRDGWVRM